MKESELRLGNTVYNDAMLQIERVNFLDINGVINVHNADIYSGVLLNEGWLKTFGFEKENNIEWRRYCNETLYYIEGTQLMIDDTALGSIVYVHQLQNLWNALTGEELTEKI